MNAAATRGTLALVLLAALAACGEPVTVSVGQLEDAIDLTRCLGKDLVCDLERASEAPNSVQPTADPVIDCMPSEEPAWHVAWTRPLDTLLCSDGPCEPEQLELAADGSVWTAATTVAAGQANLLLGHYAADGSRLLESAVDTWTLPGDSAAEIKLSLASDSQGHALVGLSWQQDEATRIGSIAKYDRAGKPLGRRVSLEGIGANDTLALKNGPRDEVLLVAGAESESRLAQLDASLRLQWVQSRASPAATDMLLDEDLGPVLVVNETRVSNLFRFKLHWFDWQGNIRSSTLLSSLSRYVRARQDAVITVERGNLVDKVFREVGRDGQVRWTRRIVTAPALERLPGYSEFSSQRVDPEGALYHFVQLVSDADPPVTRTALFRIDPATAACSFVRIDDEPLVVSSFFINARGDFYVDAHTAQGGRRVIAKLER